AQIVRHRAQERAAHFFGFHLHAGVVGGVLAQVALDGKRGLIGEEVEEVLLIGFERLALWAGENCHHADDPAHTFQGHIGGGGVREALHTSTGFAAVIENGLRDFLFGSSDQQLVGGALAERDAAVFRKEDGHVRAEYLFGYFGGG